MILKFFCLNTQWMALSYIGTTRFGVCLGKSVRSNYFAVFFLEDDCVIEISKYYNDLELIK